MNEPTVWDKFDQYHARGERVSGRIFRIIEDTGLFIELENEVFGIVHLQDIDNDDPGEIAIKRFSVGDELESVILSINPELERISLGIKQLSLDSLDDQFPQSNAFKPRRARRPRQP